MPRRAREKSGSGMYHVILRGINRQILFEDDEDRARYLECLRYYRDECGARIFGYCLMDNHIHLLLAEGDEEIGSVMKRLGITYVYWYNHKYERCGHLFQDRFRSEAVEDEGYLLTVLRYVHQNPHSLGAGAEWESYAWSSYRGYLAQDPMLECDFVLGLFARERRRAISRYRQFMREPGRKTCLDVEAAQHLSDQDAHRMIRQCLHGAMPTALQQQSKEKRDAMLHEIKKLEGISTRQIARLTGICQSVIARA